MHQISEAETRKQLIDPALEKAGWLLREKNRVGIEIPVDGYDAEPWNGVTDYCLNRENGEVIAVVEAKRVGHDPRLAQSQAETEVELRPFSNGTSPSSSTESDSDTAGSRPKSSPAENSAIANA